MPVFPNMNHSRRSLFCFQQNYLSLRFRGSLSGISPTNGGRSRQRLVAVRLQSPAAQIPNLGERRIGVPHSTDTMSILQSLSKERSRTEIIVSFNHCRFATVGCHSASLHCCCRPQPHFVSCQPHIRVCPNNLSAKRRARRTSPTESIPPAGG